MSASEKQLLENALDALDRLFDRQASVIDTWALFFATAEALSGTDHHATFEAVIPALLDVVRSGASDDAQREQALNVTDALRHYLALHVE